MTRNENNYSYMTKRIGSTVYKVKIFSSDTAKETMEDKILRMIRNESFDNDETHSKILTDGENCDKIEIPQMSRQSERSA